MGSIPPTSPAPENMAREKYVPRRDYSPSRRRRHSPPPLARPTRILVSHSCLLKPNYPFVRRSRSRSPRSRYSGRSSRPRTRPCRSRSRSYSRNRSRNRSRSRSWQRRSRSRERSPPRRREVACGAMIDFTYHTYLF